MRTKECPRYTQVGNAVPPLLAEALGLTAASILDELGEIALRKDGLQEMPIGTPA